jgi:hypothetical protein
MAEPHDPRVQALGVEGRDVRRSGVRAGLGRRLAAHLLVVEGSDVGRRIGLRPESGDDDVEARSRPDSGDLQRHVELEALALAGP